MASKYDKCIGQLMQLAKESKAFSHEEAQQLFQKLQNTANKIGAVSADQKLYSLRQAAGEFAEQSTMAAKVAKLRVAQAAVIENEFKSFMEQYKNDPAEGKKAWLVGTEALRESGHVSVQAYTTAARMDVAQRFYKEIDGLKTIEGSKSAVDLAHSGALDRPMAWSLAAETDPTLKLPDDLDPHVKSTAAEVAKISKRFQDYTRNMLNMVGCNIVDLKGRITRQVHNAQEMYNMGYDKWSQLAKDTFHPDTYDGRPQDDFLKSMYSAVVSGVRKQFTGDSSGAFKAYGSNMADQISKERLVKFNDPDAMLAYRKAMKTPGSLFHDIMGEVTKGASNVALFQKMTHDPYGFWNKQTEDLLQSTRENIPALNKLKSWNWLDDARLKNLTGYTSVDLNPNVSKIFDGIRTFIAASTQWLSTVKSLPDIAAGVNLLGLWGKGAFDSVGDFAKGWSDHFGMTTGTAFEEGNRNAYYLAEHYFMATHADWRDGNDITGLSRKVMSSIYKYNQQIRWDSVMKQTVGQTVSRILGHKSDLPLAEIKDKQFTNSLYKYGIDSNTWDTIRQGVYKATDSGEHNYITADGVRALPDATIISYLSGKGETPTPYAIERARNELATKVSVMLNDAGDHTITLAGANERALMNLGQQRGTLPRGILDLATQFRGYALANAYRTWASMIYGRGSERLVDALMNKNGELPYIARNIAVGVVAWYIADTAKNALMGLGPRTVNTARSGFNKTNMQNALTALAGSGGLGPYADMLTSDFGEDQSAPLKFIAGPTAGRLSQAASLAWKTTIDQAGNAEEGENGKFPFTQDVRFAEENIPGLSLPPVKMAVNYLILYHLENMMNPQANKDRENRINKTTGQNYFFPPSQQ